jgi:hypothetical protein
MASYPQQVGGERFLFHLKLTCTVRHAIHQLPDVQLQGSATMGA